MLSTMGQRGYTLIELLLVLALLAVCLALPAASVVSGLHCVEARGACQAWQVAAAQAQLESVWSGARVAVSVGGSGLSVGPNGAEETAAQQPPAVDASSNVARWNRVALVTVTFVGPFGSPDGAGSVYFGDAGTGATAVVRLESGLTRRTKR
jgi:prepilin-type N-terminal cleavage/methylation domain-containing protein